MEPNELVSAAPTGVLAPSRLVVGAPPMYRGCMPGAAASYPGLPVALPLYGSPFTWPLYQLPPPPPPPGPPVYRGMTSMLQPRFMGFQELPFAAGPHPVVPRVSTPDLSGEQDSRDTTSPALASHSCRMCDLVFSNPTDRNCHEVVHFYTSNKKRKRSDRPRRSRKRRSFDEEPATTAASTASTEPGDPDDGDNGRLVHVTTTSRGTFGWRHVHDREAHGENHGTRGRRLSSSRLSPTADTQQVGPASYFTCACPECGINFVLGDSLDEHLKRAHKSVREIPAVTGASVADKPAEPPVCKDTERLAATMGSANVSLTGPLPPLPKKGDITLPGLDFSLGEPLPPLPKKGDITPPGLDVSLAEPLPLPQQKDGVSVTPLTTDGTSLRPPVTDPRHQAAHEKSSRASVPVGTLQDGMKQVSNYPPPPYHAAVPGSPHETAIDLSLNAMQTSRKDAGARCQVTWSAPPGIATSSFLEEQHMPRPAAQRRQPLAQRMYMHTPAVFLANPSFSGSRFGALGSALPSPPVMIPGTSTAPERSFANCWSQPTAKPPATRLDVQVESTRPRSTIAGDVPTFRMYPPRSSVPVPVSGRKSLSASVVFHENSLNALESKGFDSGVARQPEGRWASQVPKPDTPEEMQSSLDTSKGLDASSWDSGCSLVDECASTRAVPEATSFPQHDIVQASLKAAGLHDVNMQHTGAGLIMTAPKVVGPYDITMQHSGVGLATTAPAVVGFYDVGMQQCSMGPRMTVPNWRVDAAVPKPVAPPGGHPYIDAVQVGRYPWQAGSSSQSGPQTYVPVPPQDEHKPPAHKNLTPFCCKTCGSGFYWEESLTRHTQTYHYKTEVTTPYSCSICGISFVLPRSLDLHMWRSHHTLTSSGSDPCQQSNISAPSVNADLHVDVLRGDNARPIEAAVDDHACDERIHQGNRSALKGGEFFDFDSAAPFAVNTTAPSAAEFLDSVDDLIRDGPKERSGSVSLTTRPRGTRIADKGGPPVEQPTQQPDDTEKSSAGWKSRTVTVVFTVHPCLVCEAVFCSRSTLQKHVCMHMEVNHLVCKLCQQQFTTYTDLRSHFTKSHYNPADCRIKCHPDGLPTRSEDGMFTFTEKRDYVSAKPVTRHAENGPTKNNALPLLSLSDLSHTRSGDVPNQTGSVFTLPRDNLNPVPTYQHTVTERPSGGGGRNRRDTFAFPTTGSYAVPSCAQAHLSDAAVTFSHSTAAELPAWSINQPYPVSGHHNIDKPKHTVAAELAAAFDQCESPYGPSAHRIDVPSGAAYSTLENYGFGHKYHQPDLRSSRPAYSIADSTHSHLVLAVPAPQPFRPEQMDVGGVGTARILPPTIKNEPPTEPSGMCDDSVTGDNSDDDESTTSEHSTGTAPQPLSSLGFKLPPVADIQTRTGEVASVTAEAPAGDTGTQHYGKTWQEAEGCTDPLVSIPEVQNTAQAIDVSLDDSGLLEPTVFSKMKLEDDDDDAKNEPTSDEPSPHSLVMKTPHVVLHDISSLLLQVSGKLERSDFRQQETLNDTGMPRHLQPAVEHVEKSDRSTPTPGVHDFESTQQITELEPVEQLGLSSSTEAESHVAASTVHALDQGFTMQESTPKENNAPRFNVDESHFMTPTQTDMRTFKVHDLQSSAQKQSEKPTFDAQNDQMHDDLVAAFKMQDLQSDVPSLELQDLQANSIQNAPVKPGMLTVKDSQPAQKQIAAPHVSKVHEPDLHPSPGQSKSPTFKVSPPTQYNIPTFKVENSESTTEQDHQSPNHALGLPQIEPEDLTSVTEDAITSVVKYMKRQYASSDIEQQPEKVLALEDVLDDASGQLSDLEQDLPSEDEELSSDPEVCTGQEDGCVELLPVPHEEDNLSETNSKSEARNLPHNEQYCTSESDAEDLLVTAPDDGYSSLVIGEGKHAMDDSNEHMQTVQTVHGHSKLNSTDAHDKQWYPPVSSPCVSLEAHIDELLTSTVDENISDTHQSSSPKGDIGSVQAPSVSADGIFCKNENAEQKQTGPTVEGVFCTNGNAEQKQTGPAADGIFCVDGHAEQKQPVPTEGVFCLDGDTEQKQPVSTEGVFSSDGDTEQKQPVSTEGVFCSDGDTEQKQPVSTEGVFCSDGDTEQKQPVSTEGVCSSDGDTEQKQPVSTEGVCSSDGDTEQKQPVSTEGVFSSDGDTEQKQPVSTEGVFSSDGDTEQKQTGPTADDIFCADGDAEQKQPVSANGIFFSHGDTEQKQSVSAEVVFCSDGDAEQSQPVSTVAEQLLCAPKDNVSSAVEPSVTREALSEALLPALKAIQSLPERSVDYKPQPSKIGPTEVPQCGAEADENIAPLNG